ncbi:hypothetical protein HMPREF0294_0952 [Corynebacterium glucuronolyticum ATCC 51867]|uniref:Uncharacterized protein n=1 Tax=Corynebacterium glucuronolyticum ATCC 51866 TaxID=548478 RepID=A0ABM9XN88_9CORY|nr:hypothetical protein HMPREF0294_0952 [Corynebacterium glucuronolyticum ATCC 51867]EEI62613.1 hypothetical protein HMPREF0293_1762 [Corynebacterium glucuronolyticum ATCC 51866]
MTRAVGVRPRYIHEHIIHGIYLRGLLSATRTRKPRSCPFRTGSGLERPHSQGTATAKLRAFSPGEGSRRQLPW